MTRTKELLNSTNWLHMLTVPPPRHGKEDHQTGHEHSREAMEHAKKAFEWSQEAHRKSLKIAGKS